MTGSRHMTGAMLPEPRVGHVRYVAARTSEVWSAPRIAEERSRNERRIAKMRRANVRPTPPPVISHACVLGPSLPAGTWEIHLAGCRYCAARWT